ncbi:DNA helicase [Candidatus Uabimicrobium amorphum]|uniref:DNA helicase n=2 Tax=Uabimicrobium amorphum TaxID=2596890 RepID=A0A5S9F0P0_UABAM|nr:DNA helicase [Candidatus Uabimicrobium amorphum]
MQEFSTSDIEKQLQLARQSLLDLTMRNRLINYQPSSSRSVQIIDDNPHSAYEFLVIKGKNIDIKPGRPPEKVEEKVNTEQENEDQKNEDQENEEQQIEDEQAAQQKREYEERLERQREQRREYEEKRGRGMRHSDLKSKDLEKRMFNTYQKARMIIEEQGYTALFVAAGFLRWVDDKESCFSPLILIPVELFRTRVGRSFKMRWTGEDIITNISLQAKLKEEGIALPDFEMPDRISGVDKYIKEINKIIAEQEQWQVEDDVYLDFFSFTKFVMYNDLAPEAWPEDMTPAKHHLIQSIFYSQENAPENEATEFNAPLKDLYHVMDTDASQMAIIEDAKRGKNLVVEGPPGTGKSQTITNIIAEFMAREKSVLFVSEKMAALEVVKSRLDKIGLGDFCLELHSRKARKQDVLNELQRTLSIPGPQKPEMEEKFIQIESLRNELNEYVDILQNPIGEIGLSPFDLHLMRESARQHFDSEDIPRMTFREIENVAVEDWEKAKSLCISFSQALEVVQPVSSHPWRECAPGMILPSDEDSIKKQLVNTLAHIESVRESVEFLQKTTHVAMPDNLENISKTIEATNLMADIRKISQKVIEHREWENPTGRPQHLIEQVEKAQQLKKDILEKFEERVLSKNVPEVLREFKHSAMKFVPSLNGRFRYLRWDIRFWYKDHAKRPPQQVILDLEQVNDYLNLVHDIQQKYQEGTNLFDFLWQSENSDTKALRLFMQWMEKLKFFLSRKILLPESLEVLEEGVVPEDIRLCAQQIAASQDSLEKDLDELFGKIGAKIDKTFGCQLQNVPISTLSQQIQLWLKEIHHLQRWSQYYSFRKQCSDTIAYSMVDIIDEDLLTHEDVIPCLEANLADALLEHAFIKYPFLANFISKLHESKIKRFCELDKEIIYYNRYRLSHKLHSLRPQVLGGASPNSEAGILLSEFNRKRGHMPIRKLMTLAGHLIQKVKPCFMMSPLSIAKFLDPRNVRFDVIIFDEASQVRPEDALGALLRGDQVIIMGDSQQLPPTSFFDSIIQETESEIATISDMESILHQCKRTFPTRMLTNHYRSRHESLIAVSNKQFYHNNLTVFPSPVSHSSRLGLHLNYLKNTVYDRGGSRMNLNEARSVAKAVTEHYRNSPEKSLGVGTFNIQQQQAILQEIELEMIKYPEVEEAINSNIYEPFFVKNLETIQGDERDVIFLSMGYGFDQQGKLSHNFGPLNQDGGERRLNVLISRAREKCVVFSNFRGRDLKVDSQSPQGLQVLKTFLEFAENRQIKRVDHFAVTSSAMQETLEEFIENQGYKVERNIGCGNFRIDLAVVHPQNDKYYSLAIEIDSTKYLDNPFTRERERLYREILRGLGWNLHQIWFPEWYRNKEATENALLEIIENSNHQAMDFVPADEEKIEENLPAPPPMEKKEEAKQQPISEYKLCKKLSFDTSGDFQQQPETILIATVSEITEVEGPIHLDELQRRIRTLWSIKRKSSKLTELIEQTVNEAQEQGRVCVRDRFIWPHDMTEVTVRRRFNDSPAKVDYICEEEMREALQLVIKRQHATKFKDLMKQASRFLGFKTVTRAVSDKLGSIIEQLVNEEILTELSNGMYDLTNG